MELSAFQSKLVALHDNLFNFAYTLTSNRDDANDLVQDTTLKVLDNSDKYTDNTNFKGWVFTIMRNLFVNNYRHNTRLSTIFDHTEEASLLNMPQTSGLETPEGSISVMEITDMIKRFKPGLRIPFSMHLAGYKYAEIAEHTGLPLGTVKSRIFFCRKQLQEQLRPYRY